MKGPIGIFDSGYGGLTVLKSIQNLLPNYDCIYLGDNARAPYGARSFEVINQYTLEAVEYLFKQNCPIVILACNTSSAKALRNIQKNILPNKYPNKKVLGVIRPTTEEVGHFTKSGYIGVMGTAGTIVSNSYPIEISKLFPNVQVVQQSCPMWVHLVENNTFLEEGGQYYIKKYVDELLEKEPRVDTVVLACTHYPILKESIEKFLPKRVKLFDQGDLVADKLIEYFKRHSIIDEQISKSGKIEIFTSEESEKFDDHLNLFYNSNYSSQTVQII
jgi:glutamate racemase